MVHNYNYTNFGVNTHTYCNISDPIAMMSIGSRVKEGRNAAKLSQVELAKKARVSQATISGIETGSSKEPAAIHVWNIAQALKVSFRYIMTGRGSSDIALPDDPAEAQLIVLYRNLNETNRDAWLVSGESMLRSQAKASSRDAMDRDSLVKIHKLASSADPKGSPLEERKTRTSGAGPKKPR